LEFDRSAWDCSIEETLDVWNYGVTGSIRGICEGIEGKTGKCLVYLTSLLIVGSTISELIGSLLRLIYIF
jgi:hypothetical protein